MHVSVVKGRHVARELACSLQLGEVAEGLAHQLHQCVHIHEGVDEREWSYSHHLLPSYIHLEWGEGRRRREREGEGRGGGGGGCVTVCNLRSGRWPVCEGKPPQVLLLGTTRTTMPSFFISMWTSVTGFEKESDS